MGASVGVSTTGCSEGDGGLKGFAPVLVLALVLLFFCFVLFSFNMFHLVFFYSVFCIFVYSFFLSLSLHRGRNICRI